MEKLYDQADLEKLDQAIKKESAELKTKVFGEQTQLNREEFEKRMKNEIEWLDSFWHIREKLHRRAQVQMLHENKEELEKHVKREIHWRELDQKRANKEEEQI